MKFFLDTANIKDIKKAKSLGILDGITTNPTLISKEYLVYDEKKIIKHYINICNLLEDESDLSVEVISNTYIEMIKEGKKISKLHPKIVVKIPMTEDGIKAIKYLSNNGIKTNCTLVFSPLQALLAAKSGAEYVSPFIGRLDDLSYNGIFLLKEIMNIYKNYNFKTKILAASIRNPIHISECAKIGIYAVTAPIKVIRTLIENPLTKIGLDKFLNDYNKKKY